MVRFTAYNKGEEITRGQVEPGATLTQLTRARYRCEYIVVSNSQANPDGTPNVTNVFVGTALNQPYELAPGQITDRIPISDTSQVFLAPNPGADFILAGLTFGPNACSGGFALPNINLVGAELEFRHPGGLGTYAAFPDQTITQGLWEFRFDFPGLQGGSFSGLCRNGDCSIPCIGASYGFVVQMAGISNPPWGNTIARDNWPASLTPCPALWNPIFYNSADVYKIVVPGGGLPTRYYLNSVLLATSPHTNNATPLSPSIVLSDSLTGIFLRRYSTAVI